MIKPMPHIAAMTAYSLADLKAPAGKRLVSLSQNESLSPPSPRAITSAAKAASNAQLYPDPNWTALRDALSDRHGISADDILCANGSMELIGCLAQAFAGPQNAVLAPAHAYPFFKTATQLAGARFDKAIEVAETVSVDALLDAVRPDTRVVFVANPGNPTGTRIPRSELVRLRSGLRSDILLIIDEAYGEFADHLNEPLFDLVAGGDTVILRTFSKAYGLAGMRVGWGHFPHGIAQAVRCVMNPNNVSSCGQAAAHAAVLDHDYMVSTCTKTAAQRELFCSRLRAGGFDIAESHTNFVLIRFKDAQAAQRADEALRAEGVILRAQGGAGLAHCLRATVGAAADMDKAASVLERWAGEEEA